MTQTEATSAIADLGDPPHFSLCLILLDLRIYAKLLKTHQNVLTIDEQERCNRYRTLEKRDQFAISRICLRIILGNILNIKPSRVDISYNAYGKPRLTHSYLHEQLKFNLSHSGDWMLVALCPDHDVGIDLQIINNGVDIISASDFLFSSNEHTKFLKLDDPESSAFFFQTWVAKEAYLKGVGCGLRFPCSLIDLSNVHLEKANPISLPVLSKSTWTLQTFMPLDGFYAALAVEGSHQVLNCRGITDAERDIGANVRCEDLEQIQFLCLGDNLCAARRIQLSENLIDVPIHHAFGERKLLSNFAVRQTIGD